MPWRSWMSSLRLQRTSLPQTADGSSPNGGSSENNSPSTGPSGTGDALNTWVSREDSSGCRYWENVALGQRTYQAAKPSGPLPDMPHLYLPSPEGNAANGEGTPWSPVSSDSELSLPSPSTGAAYERVTPWTSLPSQ